MAKKSDWDEIDVWDPLTDAELNRMRGNQAPQEEPPPAAFCLAGGFLPGRRDAHRARLALARPHPDRVPHGAAGAAGDRQIVWA